ncbi:MAG: lipid A biosynthesis acyltransferase [Rhodobacteraceae bacterium CG17_big_fil_post_rev_8_21_14_2_50_63_15]|nr:MAG: lipid A biosynthesis acyltransferase [Rhodobacteraceae bacterium CG17_big_fil_post_rev_8_21_14_2_50_63_15]
MPKYYLLPKDQIDRFPWIQTPVWLLEAAVFYMLLGLVRMLPFPVAIALFTRVMGFFGYRNGKKRRVVLRNLTFVLPEATEAERERVARSIFRATGSAAVELFLLGRIWRRRKRFLEFSLHPEAEEAIARKEPIVFATAHVGAWQLSPLIGREYGISISVLYAAESNPWLNRFFLARRRAFGGPLVPSIGGGRELIRELAAGRSVGAAFDTRIDQGEMVSFFGVPTQTSTMPAMLALRGYKLIPTRVVRLKNSRYRIDVMAPLTAADPTAPRKAQALDLTVQINQLYEDWIRQDPGQWLCMKRRWPKDRAKVRAVDV